MFHYYYTYEIYHNFLEWIQHSFGDGLAKHFLKGKFKFLSLPVLRTIALKYYQADVPGAYGYIVSRHSHMDQLLLDAMASDDESELVRLEAGAR